MIFSIEPRKKFETTSFAYWENFLTEDDINKILSFSEWNNLKKAQIGHTGQGMLNEKIRDT